MRELIEHLEKESNSNLQIIALGTSLGCAILWSYAELFTTKSKTNKTKFSHMIFVDQAPLQNSDPDGWDRYVFIFVLSFLL